MSPPVKKLLLCDCEGSQKIDAALLGAPRVHTSLCHGELAMAAAALKEGGPVLIACGQELARFRELAEELEADDRLELVDLRDRAGWSDQGAQSGPKMAALLADAALTGPATPSRPVLSHGLCLIYGPAETALAAAERLSETLAVTVMLSDAATADATPPRASGFEIVSGRIRNAAGSLGAFSLTIDGFAERMRGGRITLAFEPARDGARSECDIVLDLSGEPALFPAHEKRDGYVRADPRDRLAVERALFDAAQLVGEFDKPLHIRFDESLCAHSRARKPGCSRCLSVCPTGAITVPEKGSGEHVAIDPLICAGCGACASVCPSGAASYDDPPLSHVIRRMRVMIEAYREAGGAAPRLLVHDDEHGAEMISLSARYGRGLPARDLPLALERLGAFSHVAMLAALAMGYAAVRLLPGPRADHALLEGQIALARALAAGVGVAPERLSMLDVADPDALSDALYAQEDDPQAVAALPHAPAMPLGQGRESLRLSLKALAADAPPQAPISLDEAALGVALPGGAPYGAVLVNQDACTLCLSCVSLCPSGALGDDPDKPALRFQEDACLQCGVCRSACPESAITLEPRYDLSAAAMAFSTLKEEEPFCCVECGKPFGVKSTIERITQKLQDKHWMFTASDNVRLIQMCDDCRVQVQFKDAKTPFQMGPAPRVRTTEDYLRERQEEDEE